MKKKIYIQILGVIACLAVVAMHVNGCFWQFGYDRYWITANIIECICYFAVPIFFMISGATLLNYRKRYTTAVFFKKRFGKTLVPFLIWSVISAIWYFYTLLGYWIDNYELPKKWRCVIYAAALGGFLLMLVGTQILSLKNGTVDTTFKEYRNVPCILYSTGIFLFFKNIKNEKALGCLAKLTAPFSSLTFGIYLVHFYLVQMVAIYQIFPITSIKYRIFGTIAIFLISAVAVRILQMIPVIRKAIPS